MIEHSWKLCHRAAFVPGGREGAKLVYVLAAVAKMRLHRILSAQMIFGLRKRLDIPTNKSNAAGLRSSKELSSFSGLRHFWQYIVNCRYEFVFATQSHYSVLIPGA